MDNEIFAKNVEKSGTIFCFKKVYVHIDNQSAYVTSRGPALIFKKFLPLKLDCSRLRASFDDPMDANEWARQGSNNTMPDS